MKTQSEIEKLLKDEIDNYKELTIQFCDAAKGGSNMNDITNLQLRSTTSYGRILALREVLNKS